VRNCKIDSEKYEMELNAQHINIAMAKLQLQTTQKMAILTCITTKLETKTNYKEHLTGYRISMKSKV